MHRSSPSPCKRSYWRTTSAAGPPPGTRRTAPVPVRQPVLQTPAQIGEIKETAATLITAAGRGKGSCPSEEGGKVAFFTDSGPFLFMFARLRRQHGRRVGTSSLGDHRSELLGEREPVHPPLQDICGAIALPGIRRSRPLSPCPAGREARRIRTAAPAATAEAGGSGFARLTFAFCFLNRFPDRRTTCGQDAWAAARVASQPSAVSRSLLFSGKSSRMR